MLFLFSQNERAAAEKLLADARAFVGSDAVGALLETDDGGYAVQLQRVWTSSTELDLPTMVKNKVFTPPQVSATAEFPKFEGTLS